MPAFPLIFHPVGHHIFSVKILTGRDFSGSRVNSGRNSYFIFGYMKRCRISQRFVFITSFMSFCRLKVVMNSFLGKIDHKRFVGFVLLFYKVNGMFGKEIRDVCTVLILNPFTIRIDPRIVIFALTSEYRLPSI